MTIGSERTAIKGALTLSQAVQTGLRENLMLKAARADVKAAQADTRAARSQTGVQISANTYATVGDMSAIVSTSPGVMPTNNNLVPRNGFVDQNLMLMVPIYTGGRLRNQIRAASEREKATTAGVGSAQADTALQVKLAYYRVQLAEEMVRAAQARLDAAAALLATTKAQVDAGKAIEATMSRVDAERADAQRMLTSARNDREKMLLDLKMAMGVNLDSEITLAEALAFAPPKGDLKAQLARAMQERPELLAARARLRAAQAQTSATRGSLQPQIYATAMADAFDSKAMGSGKGYAVGLSLSFPLIDGGQRRAETAGARAMQERAEAEARDLDLRVQTEVRQVWLDVETGAQNYTTARTALASAQSAYDVMALRVQNQKSLLVEQLDAQAALTQARANLAQALYDHASAVARLQRAVGGV